MAKKKKKKKLFKGKRTPISMMRSGGTPSEPNAPTPGTQ